MKRGGQDASPSIFSLLGYIEAVLAALTSCLTWSEQENLDEAFRLCMMIIVALRMH
jgi:hypothetical protein